MVNGRWKSAVLAATSPKLRLSTIYHLPSTITTGRSFHRPAICFSFMFKRQRTGSVVCASCGSLVGVNDDQCYSCGRRNPGLWGFAPLLRRLGNDLGFVPAIIYGCSALYVFGLLLTMARGGNIMGGGSPLGLLSPGGDVQLLLGASGATPVFRLGMWWTVLSAGWLHGSVLHILFNMMWVRNLGPATADI